MSIPLAEILRPHSLEDFVGQDHLTGNGAILRKIMESDKMHSMIFWGPPGSGKTTLANIIAGQVKREFLQLSAISSGVKDIRYSIDRARELIEKGFKSPILFIDEIHRFNKGQQDSLLESVEKGILVLIGATTENPSFEIISPLLSRCQVYILKSLDREHLEILLNNAFSYYNGANIGKAIVIKENKALLALSGGDARKLYNTLEIVIESSGENKNVVITDDLVIKSIQANIAIYDKAGELHYDLISAFIKSVRGSDPDAAVYYLARLIEGGEDPKFICRRMVILAAEDIGLANPNALLMANSCFDAVHKIGYPEARIIMAETAIYLAASPKSNTAYMAIESAIMNTRTYKNLSVPLHLRNSPTKLMKDLGYGKNYLYAHDFKDDFVDQQYLPDKIMNSVFYKPGENDHEKKIKQWLNNLWKNRF